MFLPFRFHADKRTRHWSKKTDLRLPTRVLLGLDALREEAVDDGPVLDVVRPQRRRVVPQLLPVVDKPHQHVLRQFSREMLPAMKTHRAFLYKLFFSVFVFGFFFFF